MAILNRTSFLFSMFVVTVVWGERIPYTWQIRHGVAWYTKINCSIQKQAQGNKDHACAYPCKITLPLSFQFPEIQRPTNLRCGMELKVIKRNRHFDNKWHTMQNIRILTSVCSTFIFEHNASIPSGLFEHTGEHCKKFEILVWKERLATQKLHQFPCDYKIMHMYLWGILLRDIPAVIYSIIVFIT